MGGGADKKTGGGGTEYDEKNLVKRSGASVNTRSWREGWARKVAAIRGKGSPLQLLKDNSKGVQTLKRL